MIEPGCSIGFEIRTLSNLLKRKLFEIAPPPAGEGLTDMQGQIVDFLFESGSHKEIFQRDVEERFSIRRSTASRLLMAMEQKGVLARETVPCDARLKKLTLTPKAVTCHVAVKAKIVEIEALATHGLTNEELCSFFDVANKIKKNLT